MTFIAEVILFVLLISAALIASLNTINKLIAEEKERKAAEAELLAKRQKISGKTQYKGLKLLKQRISYSLDVIHMPKHIFQILMGGCVIVGFFFGRIVFTTFGLSLLTACMFTFLPILFVSVSANWYKQKESAILENSMVMVNSSYRATYDIIQAIRENANKPNVPTAFKTFLADVTFVDTSVERSLRKMAASIENPFFESWVDVLIKSQNDRNMIDLLPGIVDEMNEAKRAQVESQTVMKSVWREYALWVVTVICAPLALKLNATWYNALIYTTVGKVLIILLMVGLLNTVRTMIKISKPIN